MGPRQETDKRWQQETGVHRHCGHRWEVDEKGASIVMVDREPKYLCLLDCDEFAVL